MRRVVLKSPVLENCTPGSVRGAPGNRRPYLAKPAGTRSRQRDGLSEPRKSRYPRRRSLRAHCEGSAAFLARVAEAAFGNQQGCSNSHFGPDRDAG
jgi:hypothetical protein